MPVLFATTGYVSGIIRSRAKLRFERSGREVSGLLPGGWSCSTATRKSASCLQLPILSIVNSDENFAKVVAYDPLQVELHLRKQDLGSATVAYAAYTILERERNLKRMMTLHGAAAAIPNGAGVLILGDKGSGKSITCDELAKRGSRIIGDDLVVVKIDSAGNRILPGNRIGYRRMFGGPCAYETKVRVKISKGTPASIPLSAIVRISVHPDTNEGVAARTSQTLHKEALRIYENASRYPRGVPTPLGIEDGVPLAALPNVDDEVAAKSRIKMLRGLVQIPFFYVSAKTARRAAALILDQVHSNR